MDSDVSEDETQEYYLDSDNDLQEAYAKGILKPGLVKADDDSEKKVLVNNRKGLQRKYDEVFYKAPWIERLDLTNQPAPLAPELELKMEEQKKLTSTSPQEVDTVANDFQRELNFYRQAQAAVLKGIPRLQSMGIPTHRPMDYMAQMAKTDDHMQKVREALTKKHAEADRRDKVRQLRQLKKFGKKVQAESRVAKEMQKKEMLDEVKKFRKGQRKDLDFLDDVPGKRPGKVAANGGKSSIRRSQFRRQAKDQKYGFGGRKQGRKINTRDSASDVMGGEGGKGGGKGRRMGGKGGGKGGRMGGKGGGKQQRPGKSQRQKAKGRK